MVGKETQSTSTGTFKTYDVWGSVRSGGDSTDPKQRYVASIGHVADDESGLTYMRARYYEPSTGRFVNQDLAMDGSNWFIYCSNDPVQAVDVTGMSGNWGQGIALFGILAAITALVSTYRASMLSRPMIISGLIFLAAWWGSSVLRNTGHESEDGYQQIVISSATFMGIATTLTYDWYKPVATSIGKEVVGVIAAYSLVLGLLLAIDVLQG